MDWTEILKFLQALTEQVGDRLLADFSEINRFASHQNFDIEQKLDGSLVTQSDKWADGFLKAALVKQFPSYGVLTEESDRTLPSSDWCWVVDPIDGTTNFARGIPVWAISLGLLYKGTPVFGYIYVPPLRQAFHGWFTDTKLDINLPSNAAFLNGQIIRASSDKLTSNHFFSLCSRSLEAIDRVRFETKQPFPCKLRMLGAASYNFLTVALGSTLGAVEATPKLWDIAAAWVIVQAAQSLWIPLEPSAIFPLESGKNYGDRSFPTLVISQLDILAVFAPMVIPLKRDR